MSDPVIQKLTERPLLRKAERVALDQEMRHARKQFENPANPNKGVAQKVIQRAQTQKDRGTPPPLTPAERATAEARMAQIETELSEGMPSRDEMKKSPPGAVGKHEAWDRRAKEREGMSRVGKLQEWKNLRIAIDPENDDPDHSNFELFRPESTLGMEGSLIGGKIMSTPSEAAMRGYDMIDWHRYEEGTAEREAEVQALQERIAALEARLNPPDEPEATKDA